MWGKQLLVALLCGVFASGLFAATHVKDIRVSTLGNQTRVVLDLDGPVDHSLFTLVKPDRVVLDLKDARLDSHAVPADLGQGLIQRIRDGIRHHTDLRLVLDLAATTQPKSFLLKPDNEAGYRLVVDLVGGGAAKRAPEQPVKSVENGRPPRDVIVAIDAGHGGKDPGAHGPHGTYEKDVTLAIAKRLARKVDAEPGMHAVLTRKGDYFLTLRGRITKARKDKADLFVSIHADSFRDRSVQGSSVYVLSRRGASSEMARILAQQENAADLVGGVSLNDKDDMLKSVLLDLSQSASIEASMTVGTDVLGELKRVGDVHKGVVQKAGFVVLKSPDIPSILVETAFISNPSEERKLRDPRHQNQLAAAILKGIRNYFYSNPPPGTYVALEQQRRHVIQRGDTLSEIAKRYDVSLSALRMVNGLSSDSLQVGDVLRIPVSDTPPNGA